jgi:S-adenosylhomocysteine hydrolase
VIDDRVARMKLESLGVGIDALSEAQRAYLGVAASEDGSTDTEPVPVQS